MQTYHPVFSVSKRANICKRLMKLYFATLPNPGLLGFCRGTRMYLVRKLFPRPWRHVQELIMQQFLTRILHIGILLQLAAKKMNIWMFFRKNYVKSLSDFEIKLDFKNIFSNGVNPIHTIGGTNQIWSEIFLSFAFSTMYVINNATNIVIQIHSLSNYLIAFV